MMAAKRSTVILVNVATWSGILAISFPLFRMACGTENTRSVQHIQFTNETTVVPLAGT
jgi:hypothetical protein